jgi:carboxypeptidase Taq
VAAIDELRDQLGGIHDLSRSASLLAWDERTMMPPAGAGARAETLATLARVRHEMFIDDEIGRLLDEARSGVDGEARPGESIDADLVRVVARDWEKARRVPSELTAELARASSIAENAWVEAKAESDYEMLLPHLRRIVELTRRYADCFDGFPGFAHPYDPLLDEYEPEMTTERMRGVLAELREGLVPLVAEAVENGSNGTADPFRGDFRAALPRGLVAHRSDRASLRDLDRDGRRSPDHALRRREPGHGGVQRDARGRARPV